MGGVAAAAGGEAESAIPTSNQLTSIIAKNISPRPASMKSRCRTTTNKTPQIIKSLVSAAGLRGVGPLDDVLGECVQVGVDALRIAAEGGGKDPGSDSAPTG
ncbi:hypothetical protein OHA79_51535 (plasmid) [Streptomyces sp. NBC_00841]|uniref:hypothetical protein n=1 Tax=Streptomyces sp. NBC_00841 TaxID=2975847 RepID=UPI002DDB1032|nr:hypothetical protein [Streptomyces sp. NBC_00841]WSA05832.1 hypothetical protein OHA79_51535 [Streptomyces sp. NBC_00841]